MNVLITGCSRHSKEIVDCLKSNYENRSVRVIAVDMNKDNILRYNTDAQYIVPRSCPPDYIPALLEICGKEAVDIIIPYITSELLKLSQHRSEFEDNGIKISVSDERSVKILNDKAKMAETFEEYMPKQFIVRNKKEAEMALSSLGYPQNAVCVKIAGSCGGNGFAVVDDSKAYDLSLLNKRGVPPIIGKDELLKYIERTPAIIQKYIGGSDYSLCVLADNGKIIASCGYYGYSMEYGAVCSGEIASNGRALEIAEDVAERTNLCGNACFDYKTDNSGNSVLLECNPRINASLGFCRAAGIDLVYLRCKQLLEEPFDVNQFTIQTGLKMRKFYEAEYYV